MSVSISVKEKKLEVLYDGYFYDVTDFVDKHPGGSVIHLYIEGKEDATIPIEQFHYKSLRKVMATMKGLQRRKADPKELGLDEATRKRHEALTEDFQNMLTEFEAEGLMDSDPISFVWRSSQCAVMFSAGLAISWFLIPYSYFCIIPAVLLMTLGAGQYLYLGHEAGHNGFTGSRVVDKLVHTISFGLVFGLSGTCWRSTHSHHHAMPQHESKDADLKTTPLIAFTTKVVEEPKKIKFWIRYQHLLFVLCDTFIVTLTWKFNHHIKFCFRNKCWLDLICMALHYVLLPIMGIVEWICVSWLVSIYVLGNLVLNHTHLPVVENGQKLHWVEYGLLHTTNIRSSWWVDWWTGYLNYQIEHHLFPTMPGYKGKLIRDRVKAFAKKHDLPYQLCSYWEVVKRTYLNLEEVAKEIRQMGTEEKVKKNDEVVDDNGNVVCQK